MQLYFVLNYVNWIKETLINTDEELRLHIVVDNEVNFCDLVYALLFDV